MGLDSSFTPIDGLLFQRFRIPHPCPCVPKRVPSPTAASRGPTLPSAGERGAVTRLQVLLDQFEFSGTEYERVTPLTDGSLGFSVQREYPNDLAYKPPRLREWHLVHVRSLECHDRRTQALQYAEEAGEALVRVDEMILALAYSSPQLAVATEIRSQGAPA